MLSQSYIFSEEIKKLLRLIAGIKFYPHFCNMESIVKLWFKGGRIYILTDRGGVDVLHFGGFRNAKLALAGWVFVRKPRKYGF